MSDMGYYGSPEEGNPFEAEQQVQQPPKWYREAMKNTGETIAGLRDEIAALKAENTRMKVGDLLESKGFARSAAALYAGDAEKLDDWLSAHGGSLARTGGATQTEVSAQETVPSGPPATTVPLEGQQQMQQMQTAGNGGQVSAGSDAELAAALAAATNPGDFQRIAQANGWQYNLGDSASY